MQTKKNILWFREVDHGDIADVGGKGANLGEMYHLDVPVPNGFVVTSAAYFKFVDQNNLRLKIKQILDITDVDHPDQLNTASKKIKNLVKKSEIPSDIAIDIMKSYKKLSSFGGLKHIPVAVRSSATAEDLPDASFAGQQETFLNVFGEANVVNRVRDCWASLFTPRAIFYRQKKKFDHFKVGIAVPIQKMVQSEVSGIMFTINPVNNDKKQIVVETIWGLGEYIVQGTVTPDQYMVDKSDWEITSKNITPQTIQLVRDNSGETIEKPVPRSRQKQRKLTDSLIIKVAKIGQKLHNHYHQPQDIEFAVEKNQIYIVQTRPVTTVDTSARQLEQSVTTENKPALLGDPASPGIGSGIVNVVNSPAQINQVKQGQILVTPMTTPDFVPAMKKVNGIITDKGGQTSHAAIVSRELGVPCIVGTKNATKVFKDGDEVTLDGASGKIWRGILQSSQSPTIQSSKVPKFQKTATKVYVNLGEPDLAEEISKLNVDGIGLLRAEFMIANIGIHPKKMIADGKRGIFIQKLAKDLEKFCQAFNPRPVIYRATDFKTNEYRFLKWGKLYEPEESNPMLGFRGAIRYINSVDVFSMELEAIKMVRNKFNLKNLWLMIPFVHAPAELEKVKKIIADHGILRSPTFKLLMMVEIPSNVILLDKFIDVGIDGISIGSNDLTMLTLGIDRDNSEVAPAFNEMDPSVLWSFKRAITKAKKRGITSSICGQAPSNYPDLVEKLVKWGVTSISVSPDAVDRTREIISAAEKKVVK